jgi:hypothetical protein
MKPLALFFVLITILVAVASFFAGSHYGKKTAHEQGKEFAAGIKEGFFGDEKQQAEEIKRIEAMARESEQRLLDLQSTPAHAGK